MSARPAESVAVPEEQAPWLPMIVIAMAQMLMSFNVSALPVSMSGMVNSFNTPPTTVGVMLAGQGLAGFAGAALVPSLVALIANHYRGRQQAKAVGWLGSARAIAGVLAFVIVGYVAQINWRLAFGLLIVHAAAILLLSFKLKPAAANRDVKIDGIGVVLAAIGIIFISFGF